ncbi:hypothetical protein I7I50_09087 [Histoplasma capsulatum G186AR]|uniref:Uncharacterized protein n=1 Tax=Ajellomyces capsulatus TaxID=5037 RepID=A0A8H7YRY1_AJECA|nr:hypothetical protein I7I52_06606 [Histoplasma capsulatum]QSS74062.1 hypothetical protein I7I50_09087 [Histoplasma capsulatum G186AR]
MIGKSTEEEGEVDMAILQFQGISCLWEWLRLLLEKHRRISRHNTAHRSKERVTAHTRILVLIVMVVVMVVMMVFNYLLVSQITN